jgi:hypothetical protein
MEKRMTSRDLVPSGLATTTKRAFEVCLGRLHDIITDHHATREEQTSAAATLASFILRYESDPIVGNRWGELEIPVIR